MNKVNVVDKFDLFTDNWSPKISAELNDGMDPRPLNNGLAMGQGWSFESHPKVRRVQGWKLSYCSQ